MYALSVFDDANLRKIHGMNEEMTLNDDKPIMVDITHVCATLTDACV